VNVPYATKGRVGWYRPGFFKLISLADR